MVFGTLILLMKDTDLIRLQERLSLISLDQMVLVPIWKDLEVLRMDIYQQW